MAGTFAAWRLGTLQARALPFARELQSRGIRSAIVTVPWDMPAEAGVVDTVSGVELRNTVATGVLSFPLAALQQTRQILALRPRAVHVFKPKGYGGLAGRLLSQRVPLLVDCDDWEGDGGWNSIGAYSLPRRRLFHWQEESLVRSALAVTAASQLLTRRALALRPRAPETVAWIPNGLESSWARRLSDPARQTAMTDLTRPTIVLYSRFAEFPSDWLRRYLTCLSTALPEGMTASVSIVGVSPDIPCMGSNLVVDWMGYVARESIADVLRHTSIAVYPYDDSLVARSKNSVKLLELMAAGCAVIASRTGDVPAVAAETALLLDSSRPDDFAAASVGLLRNPDLINRLSSAARQRALSGFEIPTIVDRLTDVYRHAGVLSP